MTDDFFKTMAQLLTRSLGFVVPDEVYTAARLLLEQIEKEKSVSAVLTNEITMLRLAVKTYEKRVFDKIGKEE
jgi:hypothetical protein